MKPQVIFLFILLITACTISAFEIQGTVYDTNDKPLPDVLVKIMDSRRNEIARDYTDRQGFYQMRRLPGGTFKVEVTKFGFAPYIKEVSFLSSESVDLDFHYSEIHVSREITREQLGEFYLPPDYPIGGKILKHLRKGKKKLAAGKYEKAAEIFSKVVSDDPKFSRGYFNLGITMVKMNRIDKGMQYFDKAIKTNPNDPEPHGYLGNYFLDHEKYDLALKHLKKAVVADPNRADIHLLLGETYYRLQMWKESENELSKGILMNARVDGRVRKMMGNTFMKLDRLTDARDQFSLYIHENPSASDVKIIKERIKELEDAADLYRLPYMK